ncbi:hypothetical protein AB0D27_13670, partial [Streptomyces sp. NPDC048415]|uniref:hypothetical protein n=1 Tax=Streptomyces sp. NPDC048415 TaxID=3154822 RepID=UPI003444C6BF
MALHAVVVVQGVGYFGGCGYARLHGYRGSLDRQGRAARGRARDQSRPVDRIRVVDDGSINKSTNTLITYDAT